MLKIYKMKDKTTVCCGHNAYANHDDLVRQYVGHVASKFLNRY